MPTEGQGTHQDRPPKQPFRELEEMRRRFEDDIARPFLRNIRDYFPDGSRRWSPSVDIFGKGDDLVVRAELPGMKYEDIDVSVSEEALVIKGVKRTQTDVKDEDCYRSEISYGEFFRSIALPHSIDTNNVEAVYENGVLQVTLRKAPGAKSQKVHVKVKKEEV